MTKSPAEMIAAITLNIPARTGKSVEEWVRLVQLEAPPLLKDRIEWLRREHSMKSVTAKVIADKASGGAWSKLYEDRDALLATLYSGSREPLRMIYDQIVVLIERLGEDVKISPRKTHTSLIRKRQFGIIKPTRKRLDVALALAGEAARGRLEAARPSGSSDRMTHHVKIHSMMDVDKELQSWLSRAYDADGR